MENDKSRMWKAIIATFVTVGCVVSACAADVFSPLPPGAVKLTGALAGPIARSIAKWHKGNVPYHEFAEFFQKGRPKFALGDLWERKYVMLGLEDYYECVERKAA